MNQSIKNVLHFPITKIVVGIVSCFAVFVAIQNLVSKPLFYNLITSKEIADVIINSISVVVLCVSYFFFYKFYEKKDTHELSLKHLPKEFFGGFILGFSILSIVIGLLYAFGYYELLEISNFKFFLVPLSSLVIAALIEEVFFRLIFYRILENWLGTYVALFILAFAFEIPHLANDNVTLLSVLLGLLFGFAHGIMYTYTKRLWLPFAFHLGWNFAQPFYGSNLSGIEDVGYIIKAKFTGPEVLTGTIYGIEDSILSIILLLVISLIFLYLAIKEGKIVSRKQYKINTI